MPEDVENGKLGHAIQSEVRDDGSLAERAHMDQIAIWRFICIALSLGIGLFLSLMDSSIVSTAILTIAKDFGALADTTWLVLAYTLSYLGFGVIVTSLADVFGRHHVLVTCYVVFIGTSIGCGCATSLNMLIAFRAIQGLGGAGMYSLCLVVLPEISPLKLLPFVTVMLGLIVAMAGVLGPVLGGIISEHNWRWIFWLNGPVGAASLLGFVIAWPRDTHGFVLGKRRFREIDFIGCFLILAASVLFIFGLQEGGIGVWEWSSPIIVCTLLFGLLAAAALFFWEIFIWKRHVDDIAMIMPARVFTSRVLVASILNATCTGFSLLVCVIYIPLRFQIVNLDHATQAGVHLLPLLGSAAIGTLAGGGANTRKNYIFSTCLIGSAITIVGTVLLSTLPSSFEIPATAYGYQVIAGMGLGMCLATTALLVTIEVDFRDHAVAQGIIGQVRIFGGSIGVAAGSAVFNTQLRQNLVGILTPAQIVGVQTSFGSSITTLRPDQLLAIRAVYASSFSEILRICGYVAAVGMVSAFFIYQKNPASLSEKKMAMTLAMSEHRHRASVRHA